MIAKQYSLLLLSALLPLSALSQKVYEIHVPATPKLIVEGHLAMGDTLYTASGEEVGSIAVNSYYMSRDGKPVIPVMGEFHYSRYPVSQWEEEIVKMKAGGVNVIPTYIFWNLHEPREGEWHWEGNLNLRHFVELCQKHGVDVIVRIGPFCHAEMRSGGFPDWVFAKPMEVRADDPMYLHYTELLYNEIGKQLRGLYYQDGGPIIGCQIENEMQHSSAPWGIWYPDEPKDGASASWNAPEASDGVEGGRKLATGAEAGNEHMRHLLALAQKAGIVTPFYTATGWGNAAIIDSKAIPVTAAYTYPTWTKKPTRSNFMLFKDIHANPDYAPIRYDATRFPSFCAEMGVGIQKVYWSRPICTGKAAEALMIRTLGSGSNGIGYYMYHGGSTPTNGHQNSFYSDEQTANPKISYDFQAPIGEFGLEGVSYRNLRLIHSFLDEWQDELAPMETVLPAGYDTITSGNTEELRFAVRMGRKCKGESVKSKGESGFIFMVNFQDHDDHRHDQQGTIALHLSGEDLRIPYVLPKDESMILPFNLDLDGVCLKYATAQPLMRLEEGRCPHYIFFVPEGIKPEFVFDSGSSTKTFRPQPGLKSTFAYKGIRVTCLTRQEALNAIKVNDKLLITAATVLPTADGATLLSLGDNRVDYCVLEKGRFVSRNIEVDAVSPDFNFHRRTSRHASLHFVEPVNTPQVQEYFLRIHYTADVAMAFMDGVLCQDEFWQGQPWVLGLKRYRDQLRQMDMTFYFRPLTDQPWVRRDIPAAFLPDFSKQKRVLEIPLVEVVPEYRMEIKL